MTISLCGAYYVLDGTGSWSHPVPFYSMNQRQIERKDRINLKAHQALGPGMADGWSRAENIRNWRKVRNGAFSWLPNSCNFYCHRLDPGHQAEREWEKGHVTTLPQIRIWHLNPQEARRIEGLLIYRFADELNEITQNALLVYLKEQFHFQTWKVSHN